MISSGTKTFTTSNEIKIMSSHRVVLELSQYRKLTNNRYSMQSVRRQPKLTKRKQTSLRYSILDMEKKEVVIGFHRVQMFRKMKNSYLWKK